MTLQTTLQKTGFIANDATLKTLAKDYVTGTDAADAVKGVYLKVLVAHSKREAETLAHKRLTQSDALGAVSAAHALMYTIILDAVVTPDVAPDDSVDKDERTRRTTERNRRTTFARTAKATLLGYIKAGGRLAALDPASTTKEQLRSFARAAREGPKGVADQIAAAEGRLEKLVALLKEEDAGAAQEAVQSLAMKLQAIVTPPKRIGSRKMKNITLHAEGAS